MGCTVTKTFSDSLPQLASASPSPSPRRSRRRSRRGSWLHRSGWRRRSPSNSASVDAEATRGRRRSSLGLIQLCAVVQAAPFGLWDTADSNQHDSDFFQSHLDCIREQKRNELEDFSDKQYTTLEAVDRVDFDMNVMEAGNCRHAC